MRWCGRLRRSGEIAFVRRRGRRAFTPILEAYAAEAGRGSHRLAVTASKAVGGAVTRNLIRRRIRGALDALPAPTVALRLVLVVKPAAVSQSYERLAADVATVLERLSARS